MSRDLAELTKARITREGAARNFFRGTFLQAMPLLFIADMASYQRYLRSPLPDVHSRIQKQSRVKNDVCDLLRLAADLQRQSETWQAPAKRVLAAVLPQLAALTGPLLQLWGPSGQPPG